MADGVAHQLHLWTLPSRPNHVSKAPSPRTSRWGESLSPGMWEQHLPSSPASRDAGFKGRGLDCTHSCLGDKSLCLRRKHTAHSYGPGLSHTLHGEALGGERRDTGWERRYQSLPCRSEHLVTSVSTPLKLWKINTGTSHSCKNGL